MKRRFIKTQWAKHYYVCEKQDESIEMPDIRPHWYMAPECFASDNEVDVEKFPMNPKLIAKEQTKLIRISNKDSVAQKRYSINNN
jgi:hypothetical protein